MAPFAPARFTGDPAPDADHGAVTRGAGDATDGGGTMTPHHRGERASDCVVAAGDHAWPRWWPGGARRPDGIAVARNREVVPRSAWPSTDLMADDRVEIVAAAAGG